jgi:predicted transcriptional regulator
MAAPIQAEIKATFTFDEATIRRLGDAATRLSRPKSEIVRDAINEYHSRLDRELREIRAARRGGGRRTPNDQ